MSDATEPTHAEGEALIARAEARIGAKDFAGALDDFESALAHLPGDARAEFGITMARLALQEEARARSAAEALARNPHDHTAALKMGDALRRNGKLVESIAVHRTALAMAPHEPRVHHEMGLTLACWANDHEGALPHFDQAVALRSDYPEALRFRAISRRELGWYERAIDDFSRLLDLLPDDINIFENRAMTYEAMGDHARAEADFTRVLGVRGENHFYLARRGFARLALGRWAACIPDFTRALELRAEEALEWYDPAEDESPDTNPDPDALKGRGTAHWLLGEREAARRDFEAALAAYAAYRGKETQIAEVRALLDRVQEA